MTRDGQRADAQTADAQTADAQTADGSVDLGFAEGRFPPGAHVCQIFSEDGERREALERFLLAGLQGGERAACFTERLAPDALAGALAGGGVSLDEALRTGALTLSPTRAVYFAEGRFDPERLVRVLADFHADARRRGFAGARVIGEMTPEVRSVPGGSRLLEYEARVSLLQRDCPVTAVCQYDAGAFDGATMMDVLRVHPMMVVRGAVVHNPFYVAPEQFLGG